MITFFPPDTKLYGKKVSELQSGVKIDSSNTFHGTLHHLDSYPEYGADASGNFLAFNLVTQPDEQVHIKSSTGSPEKDLEPDDRFLVWKVNSTADTLEVTSGGTKEVYSAAGLKLEEE